MKKYRCVNIFRKDISLGKIYEVEEYIRGSYNSPYTDKITIINDNFEYSTLNLYTLISQNTYLELFRDVTVEYRNETINEILAE